MATRSAFIIALFLLSFISGSCIYAQESTQLSRTARHAKPAVSQSTGITPQLKRFDQHTPAKVLFENPSPAVHPEPKRWAAPTGQTAVDVKQRPVPRENPDYSKTSNPAMHNRDSNMNDDE